MGDRIAVMNAGRIEQLGTPTDIYRRPVSRFVADFIGESNFLDPARVPAALRPRAAGGTLMLRPELVCLALGEADAGALPGTVVQTSFLGSHTRVAVDCAASATPITVTCSAAEAAAAVRPGDPVALSWEPESAVVLEDNADEGSVKEEVQQR